MSSTYFCVSPVLSAFFFVKMRHFSEISEEKKIPPTLFIFRKCYAKRRFFGPSNVTRSKINTFNRLKKQKNHAVSAVLLFFKRSNKIKLTKLQNLVDVNEYPFFWGHPVHGVFATSTTKKRELYTPNMGFKYNFHV